MISLLSRVLMLMVLKSLRSPEFCNIVWYALRNSIYVLGRAMVILRILGCLLLICRMLRNWFSNMSAPCLSLGSLRPGGGVMLGLEHHSHVFWLISTCLVRSLVGSFLINLYFMLVYIYLLYYYYCSVI